MKNGKFLWSGAALRAAGIAILALVVLFAACSNPAGGGEEGDKTTLNAVIATAEAAKAGVQPSLDGTDVEVGTKWVEQGDLTDLNDAISAAITVRNNPSASQAQVDGAVLSLNAAIIVFKEAKHPGTLTLNRGALDAKITEAKTAKNGVIVAANAAGVAHGAKWVTETQMTTFQNAITAAETLVATSQAMVNDAVSILNTALGTFNSAISINPPGTKTTGFTQAELDALVAMANAARAGVVVSYVNGNDVPPTGEWVSSALDLTNLLTAIQNAQIMLDDTYYLSLVSSLNTFINKKKPGTTPDKTALFAALLNADSAMEGVVVAVISDEVPDGVEWVTQVRWDALNTAYTAAIGVETQNEVTQRTNALTAAITTFNNAKQTGTGPTVTGVTVSPNSATVAKGDIQAFTVTVTGANNPAQTVTWTVNGGGAGTSITASGVLTVGAGETATTLTVKATSTVNITKSGTATVTVIAASVPPAGLTISGLGGIYTAGTTVEVAVASVKGDKDADAYGTGTITGGSLTVSLVDDYQGTNPWTGSGSYYIEFSSEGYIVFLSKTPVTFSGGTGSIAYTAAGFEFLPHSINFGVMGLPSPMTLDAAILLGGMGNNYAEFIADLTQQIPTMLGAAGYASANFLLPIALYKDEACTQVYSGADIVGPTTDAYAKFPLDIMGGGPGPGISTGNINGTVSFTGYTGQEVFIVARYSGNATDYNGNLVDGPGIQNTVKQPGGSFSIPYSEEFLEALQSGPQYLHFELYISSGGDGFSKYIGSRQVYFANLDKGDLNVDLGTVNLASVTLSGTITVTYNSGPVPRVLIDAYDGSWLVNSVKLDNVSSNEPWSLLLPAFDSTTTITLQISGEGEDEKPLFGPISESVSVSNTNVTVPLLNLGDITE
jgi:hypothetical protein